MRRIRKINRKTQNFRFMSKIVFANEDECWIWTGSPNPGGYGKFRIGKKWVSAHRSAYERWVGPVGGGMQIDHKCGIRLCVNPNHLRQVTPKQNSEHRTRLDRNNTSGYRGVVRDGGRWRARCRTNGRLIYNGRYDTAEEANEAAITLRQRLYTHDDFSEWEEQINARTPQRG